MLDQLRAHLDRHLSEVAGEQPGDEFCGEFGFQLPRWYCMWEPSQRVWLLERVSTSLLAARPAPPHAAIFEATIEAVYVELASLIAREITAGSPIQRGSWRASLLDAYVQRCPADSLLGGLHFEATTLDPCLPPSIAKQWNAAQLSDDESGSGDPSEVAAAARAAKSNSPKSNSLPSSQGGENAGGEPDWMTWWASVIERLVDATFGPRLYHGAERYRDGDPKQLARYLRAKGVNEKFLQRIPPLRSDKQTQAAVERLQGIVLPGE